MRMKSLRNDTEAVVDVTVAITVGIVFAALMVIAYIIWTVSRSFTPAAPTGASTLAYNITYRGIVNTTRNITGGFDQTVKIIIIAVLVAVLAVALGYLMMLKQT